MKEKIITSTCVILALACLLVSSSAENLMLVEFTKASALICVVLAMRSRGSIQS